MNALLSSTPQTARPPLYKRPWIIAILVLVILLVIYYYVSCQEVGTEKARPKRSTLKSAPSKETTKNKEEDEPDSEQFVASGGRDDPQGNDWALKDRIHAINEKQRRYVQNSKHSYRYDERVDTAAPAIYSPEAELQGSLYV